MAEGIATRSSRGHRTICVPIEEEDYLRIIHDPKAFRRTLDDCFRQTPELFPVNFALGYELKDDRMSAKRLAENNLSVCGYFSAVFSSQHLSLSSQYFGAGLRGHIV